MEIIKDPEGKYGFPYIAYKANHLTEHPAMIVHLHGIGERGEGGAELDKILVHGFPANINCAEVLSDSILVMPQCPPDAIWPTRVESLRKFIEQAADLFSADPDRITLCGLSMGGYGTWFTAMAYPELFAAIAPCCGGGLAANALVLKMPIRTFHGKEDKTVSPNQTLEMVNALKDWHPDFQYRLYDGVGHDSWKIAFDAELLQWLQTQRRKHK